MDEASSSRRSQLLRDLDEARSRVAQLEDQLAALSASDSQSGQFSSTAAQTEGGANGTEVVNGRKKEWPLSSREYKRYGRQMLVSQIGLPGQLKLKKARILVVGAGGLGCPVLLYLAAAGVGDITILDHDSVELSNLHRQVLHTEERVGMPKAESARIALQALNSDITIHSHVLPFTPALFHPPLSTNSTPHSILEGIFDLVLDCTDNPATRHFLNAYAVSKGIPLVSGGAVRAEGTVGVYGLPLPATEENRETARGPCYACLFPPSPPPPAPPSLSSDPAAFDKYYEQLSLAGTGACADEGVVGVLCGVVGLGMVGEAMKVLLGTAKPALHLFSPLSSAPYRTIKTRSRKPTCPTCGTFPSPSASSLTEASTPKSRWQSFLDSPTGEWPGWSDPLCELPGVGALASMEDRRVSVEEAKRRLEEGQEDRRTRVIDTRSGTEFGIVSVDGSVNIPFPLLLRNPSLALAPSPPAHTSSPSDSTTSASPPERITFLCRRGNDSLLASRALRRYLASRPDESGKQIEVEDVKGGLEAWARASADEGFPMY
ncbi:putative URM1 activating enzyme [Rhodotorula toruloides ATCC 204091]|uniref:Putative URM1 activating enzyme n=1 Tax=Rhodotorula toruloides TaxID=5286 RepID=A0A0K3CQ27_RHOTO|nr:putative URM1 activating enzyme [Rhodotorula toruloides ATCC 204091]KAK4331243.1 Adenylyltransferase and sulfurtransferase UBA4 [Rhodotorula toruloides]PRQ70592.1 putative URM1 activating enzyme [Rhodotorula toruloides]